MKNIIKLLLCMCIAFSITLNISLSYADTVISYNDNTLKAKIFNNSEKLSKGNKNLFNIEENYRTTNELKKLNEGIDISYEINTADIDKDYSKVNISGELIVNNNNYKFKAGSDEVIKKKVNGVEMLIGVLDGEIIIDKKAKKVLISYEETKDNIYLCFSINSIDSNEVMSMITFGESMLDQETYNDIFKIEDEGDLIGTSSYTWVDSDWEPVISNQTDQTVICGTLFAESDLANGIDDQGRLLTRIQYDSNAIKKEFEDDFDINDMYAYRVC